jgi:hypothetical protein
LPTPTAIIDRRLLPALWTSSWLPTRKTETQSSRPAAFEFHLGPHPALLMFSLESPTETYANPMMGAFLAQLTAQQPYTRVSDCTLISVSVRRGFFVSYHGPD